MKVTIPTVGNLTAQDIVTADYGVFETDDTWGTSFIVEEVKGVSITPTNKYIREYKSLETSEERFRLI